MSEADPQSINDLRRQIEAAVLAHFEHAPRLPDPYAGTGFTPGLLPMPCIAGADPAVVNGAVVDLFREHGIYGVRSAVRQGDDNVPNLEIIVPEHAQRGLRVVPSFPPGEGSSLPHAVSLYQRTEEAPAQPGGVISIREKPCPLGGTRIITLSEAGIYQRLFYQGRDGWPRGQFAHGESTGYNRTIPVRPGEDALELMGKIRRVIAREGNFSVTPQSYHDSFHDSENPAERYIAVSIAYSHFQPLANKLGQHGPGELAAPAMRRVGI